METTARKIVVAGLVSFHRASLAGRVALVMGANSGIGFETARALARL
ncbi:MAG TPA: hypothetical protein VK335_14005 [Bryobacteraceae bacterium]|jgi:hypothetical protein|nr:hypothetical protein [Bryobacteraceae bacterium]HXR15483.1 hypothetical protein [Terriglobales bacterium]